MSNINLFGSSYSPVGSSTSDLLLKSRGKVKIQIGNKFIDLIKDGQINVQTKFIYQQKEVGKADGIYIVDEEVFLVVNGTQITLSSSEDTYVSFMVPQQSTAEQKQQALTNIGFIYQDLASLEANTILNSIVYVQETQKLYIVVNGSVSEYISPFPDIYNKQFIVEKNDSDKGAIYIKGTGEENGLRFDFLTIFSDDNNIIFDSKTSIIYRIYGDNVLEISSGGVKSNVAIYTDSIQSINAGNNTGFKLYISDSKSTLEVDNLIVRNPTSLGNLSSSSADIYPTYTFGGINTVLDTQVSPFSETQEQITITLQYTNQYKVDDVLYIYTKSIVNNSITMVQHEVSLISVDEQKCSFIANISMFPSLNGALVFLKKGIKISQESLDFLPENTDDINTRIGPLDEYKIVNNNIEEKVKGHGIFSKQGIFEKCAYNSNYDLKPEDNSSRFASTEWVNKIMPIGAIIMFGGTSSKIPEGWHICDGTNGTPNLIGRFIKATGSDQEVGTITSELNENNELTLSSKHLPKHSHPHKPHTHTTQENTSVVTTSDSGTLTVDLKWTDYNWNLNTQDIKAVKPADNASADSIVTIKSLKSYSTQGGQAEGGNHSHTVSLEGTNPIINESTSQEDTVQWTNTPIKIEPRAYALIFIMRIK